MLTFDGRHTRRKLKRQGMFISKLATSVAPFVVMRFAFLLLALCEKTVAR